MPKLSWKERRNICEKLRMDDQEKQEWEEMLEVKITPEPKRRIECLDDNIAFIERDIGQQGDAENCLRPHQGIFHQKEINQAAKKLEKKMEKQGTCVKCGEWTSIKLLKKNNGLKYCPYCWEVCFGKRSSNWPPGGKAKEYQRRGFHKA